MANTKRRTLIRSASSLSAVTIAAALLGATAPVASAAPVSAAKATKYTSLLDDPAALAAVKAAKLSGYAVSAKLAASCGATH